MTDSAIIYKVLLRHGFSREEIGEKIQRAFQEMASFYDAQLLPTDPEPHLLVGVKEFLEAVSSRVAAPFALVTGNVQRIGWKKVHKLGIGHFFSYGGFGDEHEERSQLIRLAIQKAKANGFSVVIVSSERTKSLPNDSSSSVGLSTKTEVGEIEEWKIENVFHFGDTPADVIAAREAGVRCIAVCTGKFSAEELSSHHPFSVVENLVDIPKLLALLGIS
jgi:phosphoglycolate phosphatase